MAFWVGKRIDEMEMIVRLGEAFGIEVRIYPCKPPKTLLSKVCDYLFD